MLLFIKICKRFESLYCSFGMLKNVLQCGLYSVQSGPGAPVDATPGNANTYTSYLNVLIPKLSRLLCSAINKITRFPYLQCSQIASCSCIFNIFWNSAKRMRGGLSLKGREEYHPNLHRRRTSRSPGLSGCRECRPWRPPPHLA
jgi:hypothetical protein